jgi:hypothetical protein
LVWGIIVQSLSGVTQIHIASVQTTRRFHHTNACKVCFGTECEMYRREVGKDDRATSDRYARRLLLTDRGVGFRFKAEPRTAEMLTGVDRPPRRRR